MAGLIIGDVADRLPGLDAAVPTPAVVPGDVEALIGAIRQRESGGNDGAVSPQGARGAMQIMPATFRQYAKPGERFDDPAAREAAAVRKILDDFAHFGGDVGKTAAAYIGGRGAVRADGTIRDDVKDALGTTPRAYAAQVLNLIGKRTAGGQETSTTPTPGQPPTWDEVLAMPEMQGLPPVEIEKARGQYFRDVVAPLVPAKEIRTARAAFDEDTLATTRAAGKAIPTWDEVMRRPETRNLSHAEIEAAREQYFNDVVVPFVPQRQISAARAAFDADTKPNPLTTAMRTFGDALRALKADADERWTRLGHPPAEPTTEERDAAAGPARMTLTRTGQPVLGQPVDLVQEPPAPLADQWESLLKPAQPRQATGSTFSRDAAKFKDAGHLGGTALELADRAAREAAADIASKDYWRNVGAAVQSVPSDWKQIMGGGLRALGEALPTAQPENPMEGGWNAVKADITAMGTDFFESAERELQATQQGLKPGFGAQATGSAIRSLSVMLPAIATGAVTSSPAAVIGILSGTTGAKAYGEARAEGLDPGQAATYAGLHALIEGGTEFLSVKQLFRKDLTAGKQLLNFLAREIPVEEAATVLQAAVDKISVRPDMTMRDLWNEIAVTAVSAPVAGGVQVGAMRGLRHGQGTGGTGPSDSAPAAPMASTASTALAEAPAAPVGSASTPVASALPEQPADAMSEAGAVGNAPSVVAAPASSSTVEDAATAEPTAVSVDAPAPEAASAAPAKAPPEATDGSSPPQEGAEGTRAAPVQASTADDLRLADAQVEHEPTPAQKEANNYRKGHLRWEGLDVAIETPKGGTRTAKDGSWSVPDFPASYGYIKRTEGADGDHVDVYVGDAPASPRVFVIDQVDAETGAFDEHKVMVGFRERDDALAAYDKAFEDGKGPARRGAVSAISVPHLKGWLARGTAKTPFNEKGLARRAERYAALADAAKAGKLPAYALEEARAHAAAEQSATGQPQRVLAHPTRPGRHAVLPEALLSTDVGRLVYTGGAAQDDAAEPNAKARPDVIRQTIRDRLAVPLNEGGVTVRKASGIYKVRPRTIRVRNQNEVDTIVHEVGHHLSETNHPLRQQMTAHFGELSKITAYAESQTSRALKTEEGFAEFIRLYLTKPESAREAAPGFHAAFEKFLDATPRYRPILQEIGSLIADWYALPAADRIMAKVGPPPQSPVERLTKMFSKDRIIFEVWDQWHPLKRMVADLKPTGMPATADPFKAAHLLAGDAAIVEDWLINGTVPFAYEQRADPVTYGKPLHEILKLVSGTLKEFNAYLIGRRAAELMRAGKENLFTLDEIREATALRTPEFEKAARDVYAYNDRLLDYAVEGGLLSEAIAKKFRQYSAYIPFFREGEVKGPQRHGEVFKRIEGGTDNIRDPIANLIDNTATLIYATNRNAVLQKAMRLARAVPGGGRWLEEVPMPQRAVRLATADVVEALREQGLTIDEDMARELAGLQTFFVPDKSGDDRKRIVVVKERGEAKAIQVNDDLLWQALQPFDPIDLGIVGSMLAVPADLLRAGVTLSPDFMARNFMRDTLAGFIQSKKGLLPVVGTVAGFKEVATRSDVAKLYRAFGGAHADLWKGDSEQTRKLLQRMATRGGFDPRTILTPSGIIEVLQRLGSISEAGTRVAEFKRSMEPGEIAAGDVESLIDAAYNAREVSVDFGMRGHSRSLRLLTRITPFLNPALQGWYKAARTGRDQAMRTVIRGGILTAFSVALFLLNRDDDWYDELEQWERNIYWHFDLGLRDGKGMVIPLRVPKPFEWGAAFGSVPEALTKAAIDANGAEFGKRLKSIFTDAFGLRTVPTAVLVPAELWANKNAFTGRQIVPDAKERLDPAQQFGWQTSLTARKAGEVANVSPAKIDHAVRGIFGTLGLHTLAMTDLAFRWRDGEAEPAVLPWHRAPVIRAFVHDPDAPNTRHVTEFYEALQKARRAEATLKLLDPEDRQAYIAERRRDLELLKPLNARADVMARLRKQNERIQRSRDLDGEEKRAAINENNARIRTIAKGISSPTTPR